MVRVTTARGAIPLEDAQVRIRREDPQDSGILYALRTDRDGLTKKVTLSTPPLSNSESPQGGVPYATYGVDVFKEGYAPLSFHNVPVFPGVVSVQPAVMVPSEGGLPEGGESVAIKNQSKQFPED